MNQWKSEFQKDYAYPKHSQAHKTGGIYMNTADETKFLALASAVLKQIASKIAKGEFNVATIQKPIMITYPITMSECLMNDYCYTDPYLNEAARTKDHVFRMKLIATNLIASLHKTHVILKSMCPLDCTLGETVYRIKEDGTRFYSEFIKLDPPTTLFQIYGPNDDWIIYGTEEVKAQIHPTFTQIVGKNIRTRFLKFKDGSIYELQVPTLIIDGLLTNNRVLNKCDTCLIKCKQTKLVASINFSYIREGQVSKIKNSLKFWSNKTKPISDNVDIQIQKLVNKDDLNDYEDACTMSQGTGSWLSHLEFDGDIFWKINQSGLDWVENEEVLTSDSCKRQDKILMISKEFDRAQRYFCELLMRWREQIDTEQSNDIQLRKKYLSTFKKKK